MFGLVSVVSPYSYFYCGQVANDKIFEFKREAILEEIKSLPSKMRKGLNMLVSVEGK